MRRSGNIFFVFLIFLLLSFVIFILSQKNLLNAPTGLIEDITIPLQRITHNSINGLGKDNNDQIAKLKEENISLLSQLTKEKELEKENQALHDQFATTSIDSKKLLPAHIIGSPGFIPNISSVDQIIIDKGQQDGIKKGSIVVYKDNLVGKAIQIFPHASIISVPTQKDIELAGITVKTQTLGVLRGQGESQMILDNVVLSDTLQKGDIVITKGDKDISGEGYPPNLVVGKIISVNKQNSALFQTADVQSLLDFTKLDTVFVMME